MSKSAFLKGFSSVLDLFPRKSEQENYVQMSDQEAFNADIKAIANDMNCAIHVIKQGESETYTTLP